MKKNFVLSVLLLASLTIAINGQESLAQKIVYDYSRMYEALNPSIVKIYADSRTGSGFLVSKDGLVATNHHVVANARVVAVQFADGRKVKADIVILNSRYDIAILKVNHAVVSSVQPLNLLPAEKDPSVKAGVPVVAFGSPLSQTFLMTQGIVSKVEDNILLGDFLIEPGNSGGPLLNLSGEVIGINTFGVQSISGAVRVGVLRDALVKTDFAKYAVDEPPADLLPTIKQKSYPTEILKEKILAEKLDLDAYKFDGGKFVVTVMTPVLVGKVQIQDDLMRASNRYKRRGKKIKDPSYLPIDEPFYEWERNARPQLENAVTFEIRPDHGLTTGSKWALGLAALGGARTVQQTHLNMEFKAEFWDFKIYRDGQLLQPVTTGRQITERSFDSPQATFVDEAYSGWFVYDPELFMTGKDFRFEIYDAREPEKIHKTVTVKADSKLIRQIRLDFEGATDR